MPTSKEEWAQLMIMKTKLEDKVNTLEKKVQEITDKNDERKREISKRNLAIIVASITLLSVLIGRLLDFVLSHM